MIYYISAKSAAAERQQPTGQRNESNAEERTHLRSTYEVPIGFDPTVRENHQPLAPPAEPFESQPMMSISCLPERRPDPPYPIQEYSTIYQPIHLSNSNDQRNPAPTILNPPTYEEVERQCKIEVPPPNNPGFSKEKK